MTSVWRSVIQRLLGDDSKRLEYRASARSLFQDHFSMDRSRAIVAELLKTAKNRHKL